MTIVTRYQLFCIVTIFELGSATLFALGIKAGQDAWISFLLSMSVGFLLLLLDMKLQKRYPGKDLGEILVAVCGKWLGVPLALFYTYMFLYFCGIILREFGEMIVLSTLSFTPVAFIVGITDILVTILAMKGLKVMGRAAEICLIVIVSGLAVTGILLFASDAVKPSMLLPILGKGILPLFSQDFLKMINFPFGEMIIFLVYWKYVSHQRYEKPTILGYLFAGLMLLTSTLLILSSLGVDLAEASAIPLLRMVRLINVANVIANLDGIAVNLIFLCGFFKIYVYFDAAVLTAHSVLRKIDIRFFIFGAAVYVFVFAMHVKNYTYHIWLGNYVHTPYFHTFIQIGPLLLLLASVCKGLPGRRKSKR